MLLGALISSTDPLAVLAILKQAGAPPNLELQIPGESLFHDGIALTMFILFYTMAFDWTGNCSIQHHGVPENAVGRRYPSSPAGKLVPALASRLHTRPGMGTRAARRAYNMETQRGCAVRRRPMPHANA